MHQSKAYPKGYPKMQIGRDEAVQRLRAGDFYSFEIITNTKTVRDLRMHRMRMR